MKIALCTTTIHVPHVLKLMRKCSEDANVFVALEKEPPAALAPIDRFMMDLADPRTWVTHGSSHWKCSPAIGWNTLARRNIAFLEALKWGADVIYSWDNDNIPVGLDHFDHIEIALGGTFSGIKVGGYCWFDPGALLVPATRHRGVPHNVPIRKQAGHVTDAKVGVAAGFVLGDPDVDATTRMEHRPDIGQVHLLAQTGVVVDPHTWTVFNTQNTAVIRELIPAWFMMPNVGRHDDIYASLIVQRVARERGYHVHFGQPFTYQQRNEHNLVKDIRAEIDGYENVQKLADLLDSIILPGKSVIEDTCIIYSALRYCDFLPIESVNAALLWVEDCAEVL